MRVCVEQEITGEENNLLFIVASENDNDINNYEEWHIEVSRAIHEHIDIYRRKIMSVLNCPRIIAAGHLLHHGNGAFTVVLGAASLERARICRDGMGAELLQVADWRDKVIKPSIEWAMKEHKKIKT